MTFMKSMFFLLFFSLTGLTLLLNMDMNMSLSIHKILFYNLPTGMDISFMISMDSMFFFFMVSTVSSFVCVFSEIYMEYYNIKKYMILFFLFYFSMMTLIFSSSPLSLVMGWDFLGISSIFLIMFYPNTLNMKNSILTMFFNRLGDLFLIISVISMMVSSNLYYPFFSSHTMWMLMICIFTKSAQFPFTLWLPLAMSAPTPISSMVHSSTLVTAGIFMLNKFFWAYSMTILMNFVYVVSIFTFLTGGIMCCYETDFKKVIAYSTMSQISMMLIMLSLGFKLICFMHMFMHAMFKSMLFSCSGLIFFTNFMDQIKFNLSMLNINFNLLKVFMMFLIYMMSGLIFSMSFFSKDYLIELSFSSIMDFEVCSILILGSVLTMCYCSILMESVLNKNTASIYKFTKSFKGFFQIFLLLYFFNIFFSMVKMNYSSFIIKKDLMMLIIMFLFMMLLNISMFDKIYLKNYLFNQNFTTFFYRESNKIYYYLFLKFLHSDSLLINKTYYFINNYGMKLGSINNSMFILFM